MTETSMVWFGCASVSALISATAAIIQKKMLSRVSALEFSFLLSLTILFLSLFIPFSVDITSIPPITLMMILGKSVIGGLAFLFVMTALEHNQISGVLPLLGLTPAVTALLSFLLTGELLNGGEWLGLGLMVAGASVLESRPGGIRRAITAGDPRGYYYISGALGLFAVSSIADKALVSGYKTDPLLVLVYQHIMYCLLFGLLLWRRTTSIRAVLEKGRVLLPLLGGVAVLTLAYRFAQLEATKDAPVALVLAVKRTSILYASFFGGRLFSDDRLATRLIGASLIVGSGFIILRNVG